MFGFFLYKHFSARLFDVSAAPRAEQTEPVDVPEVAETDLIVADEPIAVESVAAEPMAKPVEIPVTAVIEQQQKKRRKKPLRPSRIKKKAFSCR